VTTIFEKVEAALNALSPAVPWMYKQYLTASGAALPDTYLVYSLVSSPAQEHADDVESLRTYTVQVSTYKVSSMVGRPGVEAVMVSAGFMAGNQRETSNYPDSTHFGLSQEFTYLE
jgi:hypothetical protein